MKARRFGHRFSLVNFENPFQHASVPVALPPFTIEITKGDKRLCFALDLVEMENQQCNFLQYYSFHNYFFLR